MKINDILPSNLDNVRSFFKGPLNKALGSLSSIADDFQKYNADKTEAEKTSQQIFILLGAIVKANGEIDQKKLQDFSNFLSERYSEKETKKILSFIENETDLNIKKTASHLAKLSENEKISLLSTLIELACSGESFTKKQKNIINELADIFGIPEKTIAEIRTQAIIKKSRHDKILKSGAGIIMALVIIFIFVMTATLLKSVLFGLMLAYFFLPVEKWFEKNLRSNSLVITANRFISLALSPFRKTSQVIRVKIHGHVEKKLSPKEKEIIETQKIVNKACTATIISFLITAILIITLVSSLSASYVAGLSSSVKGWADEKVKSENELNRPETSISPTPENKDAIVLNDEYFQSLISASMRKIESLRPEIEKMSWFRYGVNSLKNYIQDEKNREALLGAVLSKSSGVFSYTAGFFSGLFIFLLHTMLTVFFFSLFLQKFAYFSSSRKRVPEPGDFLVRGIFSSSWMPQTTSETREEARNILNTIFGKLKAWVKGYLSIIMIESTIYVTMFFILSVPYAPILGLIAGCTILLPFIGPVTSAILTILVCFAVGNMSMLNILGVACVYVVVTGMMDQLFLYPKFVGNALGLSTIETIIVVLLGGLFAGLPGMIFAVPTASVLKFIIPKIYECWSK